jgi:hypothetical protein
MLATSDQLTFSFSIRPEVDQKECTWPHAALTERRAPVGFFNVAVLVKKYQ